MNQQRALLRRAVAERGEASSEIVAVDHLRGTAVVAEKRVGLIYPDSFFRRTRELGLVKTIDFFFRGRVIPGSDRARLLSEFQGRNSTTSIWATERGRESSRKGEFDEEYFTQLGRARWGLCPHHPEHVGAYFPPEHLWTYRFVECCLVRTIPILFRATPLSPEFTRGFRFVWDDDEEFIYTSEDAEWNRELAETRFSLPR